MNHKQKQHLLAYLGFYCGPVDGIWGEQSKAATEAFQDRDMTGTDGIFGPDTEIKIRQVIGSGEEETPTENFRTDIQYFCREEFRCTCGGRGCNGFPAEPEERLVRNAELARIHFGSIADVSSGVRCSLRNRELPGSAANSLHLRGKAMDFRIRGVDAQTLCAYVKSLPEVDECYAIDSQFIHMGVLKTRRE